MSDSLDVHEIIRKRLHELGLGLDDLATALGVTSSRILQFLTRIPLSGEPDLYEQISLILNFPPGYLFAMANQDAQRNGRAVTAGFAPILDSNERSIAPMQMYAEANRIEKQLQAARREAAIERWIQNGAERE